MAPICRLAAAIVLLALAGGSAQAAYTDIDANFALRISCGLPVAGGPDRNIARVEHDGRTVTRFRLAAGDTGRCPADIRRGGYARAELRSDALPRDRDLRITFGLLLPAPFPARGFVQIGQFHQENGQPLLLLGADAKIYQANPGSGLRALGAIFTRRMPLLTAAQYGHWHRITMAARFSQHDDGYIRVYADGDLRFEAKGPTVATQPYFKIGIYARSARVAAPLIAYVDRIDLTIR